MKRIVILAGVLLLFVSAFAAKTSNLENTIQSHYNNRELNVEKSNSKKVSQTEKNISSTKVGVRDQIIAFAQRKLGSPYVWGATGPNSFDCSGFVGYVFKSAANLTLPRVSSDQATFKPKISSMNMKKGDLVFFNTTGRGISHVGIYMGNRQFIHASSGSRRVTVSSLDSSFYSKTFRWAINPFS